MYRNSPTINFIAQISRKIADKLIRDFKELENLQSSRASANRFAFASLSKIKVMIFEMISEAYPRDNILINDEEEHIGSKDATKRWLVNPIAGFDNFTRSGVYFCITMSLEIKKEEETWETVAGFIDIPMLNEVYYAEKNSGSFASTRRIRVSDVKEIKQALICGDEKEQFEIDNLRLNNCLPIDLSLVASGKYDASIIKNDNDFDNKLGLFIVKEAGGEITNTKGKAYEAGKGFIASNGKIHKELVKKMTIVV
jgi:myo-inositol-1(or 4)-monophosphatase